jgi:hypothetical protein
MGKAYHKILIFVPLILFIALSACEKVIDIDLNEAEPRLVVEGAITLNNGPYAVRLTTSGDFFTGEGIAPVSDADVFISGSDGQSETLVGVGNGIYITRDLQAVPYTAYSLKIRYKDEEYTASDTLFNQVNIEELSYSVSELGKGGPDGSEYENHYDILCKFKDASVKRNFYLLQISINGEEITGMRGKYYLLNDERLNGQMVSYPFFGVGANANDTIKVSLSAIGPATYDYFRTLNDALSQGGMGSTPYNPISNVSNNALGFFGTFTFDSESIIVKENQ